MKNKMKKMKGKSPSFMAGMNEARCEALKKKMK